MKRDRGGGGGRTNVLPRLSMSQYTLAETGTDGILVFSTLGFFHPCSSPSFFRPRSLLFALRSALSSNTPFCLFPVSSLGEFTFSFLHFLGFPFRFPFRFQFSLSFSLFLACFSFCPLAFFFFFSFSFSFLCPPPPPSLPRALARIVTFLFFVFVWLWDFAFFPFACVLFSFLLFSFSGFD